MKEIVAYLNFDGDCRDAMTFYQKALGGELHMVTFAEGQAQVAGDLGNRIMHARLSNGPAALMASDTMPGMAHRVGSNISISVHCESAEEIDRFYSGLVAGGKATMPLQDAPWGARFGMLTDRFGVQWMFNYPKPA